MVKVVPVYGSLHDASSIDHPKNDCEKQVLECTQQAKPTHYIHHHFLIGSSLHCCLFLITFYFKKHD